MSNTFEFEDNFEFGIKIKIVGVGGGGNNAVNHMIKSDVGGVDFIVINTDKQALMKTEVPDRVVIGEKLTKGHGAGGNPEIGAKSAEESKEEIEDRLKGANMIFITAGMGGGTGTGAAPVVARIAKDLGILTIGIVTRPFAFEGARKKEQADRGIEELRKHVDSLIVIPNERLKVASQEKITLLNGFKMADDVLRRGVQSISDLINIPGYMNLDFADVTSIMEDAGMAHMGVGEAVGKDKADVAVNLVMSSPLLESSIKGARRILVNITISPDVILDEVDLAMTKIEAEAHPDANIFFGIAFDETLNDEMSITIIATGFDADANLSSEWTIPAAQERPRSSVSPAAVAANNSRPVSAPAQPSASGALTASDDSETTEKKNDEFGIEDDFDSIMDLLNQNSKKNLYDE